MRKTLKGLGYEGKVAKKNLLSAKRTNVKDSRRRKSMVTFKSVLFGVIRENSANFLSQVDVMCGEGLMKVKSLNVYMQL